MPDDLVFSFPGENNPRRAFRVQAHDLIVQVPGFAQACTVKDLSSAGLAFWTTAPSGFSLGDTIELDLFVGRELFLEQLEARIVRVANDLVGCEFVGLRRWQEFSLDKLVLEVQKEQIARDKIDGDT